MVFRITLLKFLLKESCDSDYSVQNKSIDKKVKMRMRKPNKIPIKANPPRSVSRLTAARSQQSQKSRQQQIENNKFKKIGFYLKHKQASLLDNQFSVV